VPSSFDTIICTNNFLDTGIYKIVKRIQMLLYQSSNLKNWIQWESSVSENYSFIGITIISEIVMTQTRMLTNELVTLRNSGISWNLSTAEFTGAVRNSWSMIESVKILPLVKHNCIQKKIELLQLVFLTQGQICVYDSNLCFLAAGKLFRFDKAAEFYCFSEWWVTSKTRGWAWDYN